MAKTCVCGHEKAAHQHYRCGSDCAICGDQGCASFVSDTVIGRLIGTLGSRRENRSSTSDRSDVIDIRQGAA